MTRVPVVHERSGSTSDGGFTLIEVVVALFLLGAVATAVLIFFIKGVQTTTHLQRSQSADAVAMEAMEQVRSVSALAPSGGVSGILVGRTDSAVMAAWNAAALTDTSDSNPVSDPDAGASSHPTVPIEADVLRSGITYHVTTLIGQCYRVASGTGGDQPCLTTPITGVAMLRVTIVVTWKPTSASQCDGATVCTYRSRSLIDPTTDAVWNLTTEPVAYNDDNATMKATDAPIEMAVVANDLIGPVTANPVWNIAPTPSGTFFGNAVAVTATQAPWLVKYSPNGVSSGKVTFDYQLRDGAGRVSNTATVTVNVTPVAKGTTINNVVRGSTTDINLASQIVGTVSPTANARIVVTNLSAGGAFVSSTGTTLKLKVPSSGATASFSYTITDDATQVSNAATVSLNLIDPAPANPTAVSFTVPASGSNPLYASTSEVSTALNVLTQPGVTGTDTSSTIVVDTPPASGTVVGSNTRSLSYKESNIAGRFTFTYHIVTGGRSSNVATVTINVTPTANPDSGSVRKSSKWTTNTTYIDVLSNDLPNSLSGSNPSLALSVGAASCGTAAIVTDKNSQYYGRVKFTAPNQTSNGCTMTYTIDAGSGITASATITVTVTN